MYMYTHIMYMYICIHMYTYIERDIERETEREIDDVSRPAGRRTTDGFSAIPGSDSGWAVQEYPEDLSGPYIICVYIYIYIYMYKYTPRTCQALHIMYIHVYMYIHVIIDRYVCIYIYIPRGPVRPAAAFPRENDNNNANSNDDNATIVGRSTDGGWAVQQ